MSGQQLTARALATVFYDGSCPLCSREISHYRKLAGAENIHWIDIAADHQQLAAFNLTQQDAMARFHLLDENRLWHTGAWGFAKLWTHLAYYRWLSRVLYSLRLLPLLDLAYTRFARWRIRKQCNPKQCR